MYCHVWWCVKYACWCVKIRLEKFCHMSWPILNLVWGEEVGGGGGLFSWFAASWSFACWIQYSFVFKQKTDKKSFPAVLISRFQFNLCTYFWVCNVDCSMAIWHIIASLVANQEYDQAIGRTVMQCAKIKKKHVAFILEKFLHCISM